MASFPGMKFSTKTSERSTSFWIISNPSGALKFTVMDRLFRFTARKYADSGGSRAVLTGAVATVGAAGGYHEPIDIEKRPL